MAPRLSRWIALTLLAAGAVATSLLTTGGTPLIFAYAGGSMSRTEIERSPEWRRIEGVRSALARVQVRRALLERQAQVASMLARTDADPQVLTWEGSRLVVDHPATAAVDSLWRTLPGRRGDIRTFVPARGGQGGWWDMGVDLGPDGTCILNASARTPIELVRDVRNRGGDCLFAEQFGVPGKGIRRWQQAIRGGLWWEGSRPGYFRRGEVRREAVTMPAWFEAGGGDLGYFGSEYGWRRVNRLEMACAVGRGEECEAAVGVSAAGWPDVSDIRGLYFHQLPIERMPRDLLLSVGPEKFAEIWSSDDPIGVSYARVTGTPMEGWVMQWARRFTGVIHRDNALSLVGWVGALGWIALLIGLVAQRLKQRTVT